MRRERYQPHFFGVESCQTRSPSGVTSMMWESRSSPRRPKVTRVFPFSRRSASLQMGAWIGGSGYQDQTTS